MIPGAHNFAHTFRLIGFEQPVLEQLSEIEFGIDLGNELGVADSGELENDLIDLFTAVGLAAKEKGTAVVFFVDERLFEFPEIGPLSFAEAKIALVAPAEKLGVQYEDGALDEILTKTRAYPYFFPRVGCVAGLMLPRFNSNQLSRF